MRRFARDAGGATAVEYGLILALLSIVVIAAVTGAGTSLFTALNNLSNTIAHAH